MLIFLLNFAKYFAVPNRTPPLPALKAFAALVRLGSIGAAANELSLTPGAVSHQIRALEDLLGVSLVERHQRRVVLTEQGRIYGYQVRQALEDIADATENVRSLRSISDHEPVVRVAVLPSFLHGWLLPRLSGFSRLYGQVRLVFHGSMAYADLDAGQVDCAIRFGHGQWPNASVRPLMGDSLLLVASPKLLGKHPPTSLAQLMRLPLLHSSENWATWLASLDESALQLQRPRTRMEFTDSTQLLEAVRMGYGMALTRRSIADHLLQQGELVKAHEHECPHASGYSALLPLAPSANPAVEQWLGWLQLECARYARQQRFTIQIVPKATSRSGRKSTHQNS